MSHDDSYLNAIKDEERSLDECFLSLSSQQKAATSKFSKERVRARELTSGLVKASSEDKVQLASDEALSHAIAHMKQDELQTLEMLLQKPYFGRIVVEEPQNGDIKALEYKIGYAANPDCRIIDWRKAPVSKLYYEYQEGDEYCEVIQERERNGKVALRNTIVAERSELKQISCRHGSFEKQNGKWIRLSGLRSRKGGAEGLPNILSLITPAQFKTITEECDTAVLIQGVAGSGKTTVALHRLAWLLHKDNSDVTPEESIVIVLNNSLKAYVSYTLPSMEITGVRVATYFEWARECIGRIPELQRTGLAFSGEAPPPGIKRLKSSMAMLLRLEEYCSEQDQQIIETIEHNLPWQQIPSGLFSLYQRFLRERDEKNLSVSILLGDLKEGIKKALTMLPRAHPRAAGLAQASSVLSSLEKNNCVSCRILVDILSEPDQILKFDQTHLLDRELIEEACKIAKENLKLSVITGDDLPLLLRLCQLKHGGIYPKDKGRTLYKHIVLDEVQDFSPPALASVIGSAKSPNALTLVGDTAQQLSMHAPFPGWEALQKQWHISTDISRFVTLNISHRSTKQIMKFADSLLGIQRSEGGREGRAPIWFKCKSEKKALPVIISWLLKARERFPHRLTSVICPDKKTARYALGLLEPTFGASVRLGEDLSFTFEEGIVVSDVRQTKGLEFHAVLLWNPDSVSYPSTDYGKRALYTAATRAESYLSLITWKKPSPLLPNQASSLLRFIDYTAEDEG